MNEKLTVRDIEDIRPDAKGLKKLAGLLGYKQIWGDGASLEAFFDDNPGAGEAVLEFVLEHAETYGIKDEDDEDPEACPGCGCKPGDGVTANCDSEAGCAYYRGLGNDNSETGGNADAE